MLQPLQLKDVSARHANQIFELEDFFRKADCVLGTAESLPAIASRLQRDRAFHRDLTSHIWVVIHSCHGNVSYADLLGMLAIAAAGTRFAAEAHEDDAHALLRFVMEARQSLDGAGEPKNTPVLHPPPPLSAAPPQPVQPRFVSEQAILRPQGRPLPVEFSSLEVEETGGSRKRFLWIAACVLAALSIGFVLHERITPGPTSDTTGSHSPAGPVAIPSSAPAPMASEENNPPSPPSDVASAAAGPGSTTNGSAATARSPHGPAAAKPSTSAHPSAPPAAVATIPAVPAAAPAAPGISAPVAAHAAPTPAPSVRNGPAAAPAARLAVPSAAAASSTPDLSNTVGEHHAPRLLHRTPEEQQELAATSRPADIATSRTGSAAAPDASHGTVRANSVGVHAANVLYSPIPAYPAAASAAHVQGEVKLETDVNRDGNVVSVRVISGPPLLREAALDAAQRWRYRPDKVGGQSLPISAVTVFEFHLP